ncbi:hypothetical protein [Hansschlegelia plantiphila]|uniref:Uncharacterized protein n=1 Tax=Hansschlegelia plantiphila TaxID=374655 RepID=A0A9W6IYG8_9HYPH|nr:hypothetical protein [Hansschlegelia plantiphila]GLK66486.1 hypothetical protein GCM10008179_01240 [Hansschlegelia plantiphila]
MKNLILSTALAAGLGALALAPASAAMPQAPVAAASATSDVACRTVEKRTMRNGVTRIERTQRCDGGGYDRDRGYERSGYRDDRRRDDRHYVERRDYRDHAPRPGITLQLPR